MKNLNLHKLLMLVLAIVLSSCVGEVENSKAKKTEFVDPALFAFPYEGILDARAIAHDKIEIDFYPAGDPSQYTHYLTINGSNTPIELKLDTIPTLSGGLYRYALTGLSMNSFYTLKISAENDLTGYISKNEKTVEDVKTFDNKVADFKGIAKVSPLPGSADSKVIIEWNPATFDGIISASAYDPVYYEIIFITDAGGYTNINNAGYSGSDRVVLKGQSSTGGNISYSDHPTKKVISGLLADTTYYFQVRAVHKTYKTLYDADPNNVPIDRELNSVYIRYKTAPITNFVDFDRNSINVNNSPAEAAFSKIRVNWDIGEGNYTGYRLFVTEYDGPDIANDDEILQTELADPASLKYDGSSCIQVADPQGALAEAAFPPDGPGFDSDNIACFDLPTTVTNIQIKSLKSYTGYHIKVALCRDGSCPMDITHPKVGILSSIRYITTEPTLAVFDGINFVVQPQDPANINQITLKFNAPDTGKGYADTMEVYCIDPTDYSIMDKFPDDETVTISAEYSGAHTVSACGNLTISTKTGGPTSTINNFNAIGSLTELKIDNVSNTGVNYCFGMTPAIINNLGTPPVPEYRMDLADMVVRCISPEVKVPTSDEFPGVDGACSVTQNNATINWQPPTGGIYQDYSIFMKKKSAESFNFGNAIAEDLASPPTPSYTVLHNQTGVSKTFLNLEPGSIYEVGILTRMVDGNSEVFYSEPNLGIVECKIPLPVPTFNEWTRVFAIGPKVNGRFPRKLDPLDDNPWPSIQVLNAGNPSESRMYEALSVEGIPYEVPNTSNSGNYWSAPPGEVDANPAFFNFASANTFDGAVNSDGIAVSNTGIISLAWKEVTLNYLQPEFEAGQIAQSTVRSGRSFGYRIYRSSDYGLSYQLISGNRLIKAVDYEYRPRPNVTPVTERMGFFTDYSVRHADELRNISRARIYQYKIVPVYNNIELSYADLSGSPHHMIRVTLPPPNMALVHRKMANRTACMELEKSIEHANEYVCAYNGLGARPRFLPWIAGSDSSVFDQGGDLLIDRFELGCQFTRGKMPTANSVADDYKSGPSYFNKEADPTINYEPAIDNYNLQALTDFSIFQGFANNNAVFKGCGSKYTTWSGSVDNPYIAYSANSVDLYGGSIPTYNHMIFGDCMGSFAQRIPVRYSPSGGSMSSYTYKSPGLTYNIDYGTDSYDYSLDNPVNPQFGFNTDDGGTTRVGLFNTDLRRSRLAIGEFAAVFYNSNADGGLPVAPIGPGYDGTDAGENLTSSAVSAAAVGPNCFVNLASIGANQSDLGGTEYWRSRWFPMGLMDKVLTKDSSQAATKDEAYESLYSKTLSEIVQLNGLYDNRHYKPVDQSFWDLDRIHPDMQLSHITVTNSAKMPIVYGMTPKEINEVCSTFKIQVGVQSENGSFSAIDAPQEKRILRRTELISAAAFPDSFDDNLVNYIELGDTTGTALEVNGSMPRSCFTQSNSNFINADDDYDTGEILNGRASHAGSYKGIITGSGGVEPISTESCTSKYGIQDLVGNGAELTSEELFCDYGNSSMAIYFGAKDNRDFSFIYSFHNQYGYAAAPNSAALGVLRDAPLKYYMNPADMVQNNIATDLTTLSESPNYLGYEAGDYLADNVANWQYFDDDSDGTPDGIQRINNQIWQWIFPDAGYCSLVDGDKNRVNSYTNFRSAGGVLHNVFEPDGSVNPSMVLDFNLVDQRVVEYLRSGDGYFLNFGASNLSPSLSLTGSSAIEPTIVNSVDRMVSKYFNPVAGMPLTCDNYSSTNVSCGELEAGDNKEYTLPAFWKNIDPANPLNPPVGVDVPDFFIGRSKIESVGLSEVDNGSSFFAQSHTVAIGSGATVGLMITEYSSTFSPSGAKSTSPNIVSTSSFGGGTFLQYYHVRWAIPRESVLNFANGEKGRYSLKMVPRGVNSKAGYDKGARCAIKINED